ncbi:zf-HC2 domain-containing protein [Myxococcus sp. AM009]|uniref:zf-HC2 domain-containing protein n=1 Tax=Myxococcus sp. AM009 TaxID=2745137 RepID=UPI001594F066|nr:zf-HC2 domain-containing protein [Myxococcus sp. AM009]NVI99695.1 zf-HC2 domain-containing protein [Myxococcus sp. AM009]
MSAHESEWTLRRLSAGELTATEAARVQAHAASCEACAQALRGIHEAQARFEADVPFERFEAGVEQALRRRQDAARPPPRRWVATTVAIAASLLVVVLVRPLLGSSAESRNTVGLNRLKGGATAELRIGGGLGPQREAIPGRPEAIDPGERVMLGYKAGAHRYVAALSVDAIGEVTPLHPEDGASAPVAPGSRLHWLPGGWEFTGSGAERVIVVLSDEPLPQETLVEAARRAFAQADGDVGRMAELEVPGAQTHWVLQKP